MRADVLEVIDRLRAPRRPALLRLLAAAGLDDDRAPEPWPDVVEPYRWLLQRIGDGVTLTGAGYLPPSMVLETMQQLGWDADWIGKGNREDLTVPVAELRESARRLGLVRVYRGELRCSAAGARLRDDPPGLWWHIAAHLPLGGSDAEKQAGLLWLLTVATGSAAADQLVAEGLGELGWADGRTGRPLGPWQAFATYRDTWTVLDRLGVLGRRSSANEPPTLAAVELARAVLHAPEPSAPRRPGKAVPALELEVALRDVEPRVWRRVVVPGTTTLRRLHDLLQAAMGWENRHLYLFAFPDGDYGDVEDMELGDVGTKLAQLVEPGSGFRYDYDFGDGWEHDVRVLGRTRADGAHCLDGAGACPPEDCGGVPGYERLLEVLADPAHPEHAELAEWLGRPFDPAVFDPDRADAAMQRAARR